ncbi:MAG: hypothetical protein U0446_06120 [Dehalococcoidia bacterium]
MSFLNSNAGALTVVFSGIVALATVVYAILTWRLTSETARLRKAQTEPSLHIWVEPSPEWINIIFLYVANVGAGLATNIHFRFDHDSGSTGARLLVEDFTKSQFLTRGLQQLGPGQQLRSANSSFVGSFDEKIRAVINVAVTYEGPSGRRHNARYVLDFSEFEGMHQFGRPPLSEIAESVKKIQTDLGHLSTGFHKLRVDTYDAADREAERLEWERAVAERRQRDEIPGLTPPDSA